MTWMQYSQLIQFVKCCSTDCVYICVCHLLEKPRSEKWQDNGDDDDVNWSRSTEQGSVCNPNGLSLYWSRKLERIGIDGFNIHTTAQQKFRCCLIQNTSFSLLFRITRVPFLIWASLSFCPIWFVVYGAWGSFWFSLSSRRIYFQSHSQSRYNCTRLHNKTKGKDNTTLCVPHTPIVPTILLPIIITHDSERKYYCFYGFMYIEFKMDANGWMKNTQSWDLSKISLTDF